MTRAKFAVVFLLALVAQSASARHLLQAGGCPIDPAQQELDFSGVAASCGDSSKVCNTCVCALVDVFTPALVAGGVSVNASDPSDFPLDKSAEIIRQCAEQYLVSMLMANVNVTALASLSECSFGSDDQVPDCLASQVADIQPNVTNTVYKPDTATDRAATDANDTSATTVPAATSPDDTTVKATSRVEEPATPAATPAAPQTPEAAPAQPAAPAGNGADVRGMSVMASVGALLLAALLL